MFLSAAQLFAAKRTMSLQILNHLFAKTFGPLIALCSEYEAVRYGKFLGKLLKLLHHWKVRRSESLARSEFRAP
jgi:hypothetical protein